MGIRLLLLFIIQYPLQILIWIASQILICIIISKIIMNATRNPMRTDSSRAVPTRNRFEKSNPKKNYFFGIFFKISKTNFQYFCADEICALSSGECAPLMVGPKLIISNSG